MAHTQSSCPHLNTLKDTDGSCPLCGPSTHGRVTTEFHADGNGPRCDAHPERYAAVTLASSINHSRLCVECTALELAAQLRTYTVTVHDS